MIFEHHTNKDGKICLKLNISKDILSMVEKQLKEKHTKSLADEEVSKLIQEYILIDIASFQHLKNDSANIWKEMFESVEYVFNRMSDENIADYVSTFIVIHYAIINLIYQLESSEKQTELLYDFCIEIAAMIADLEERINFTPHVIEYCNKLPIIENPEIGTREQDSPETTFYPNEVKDVCCLIVLIKCFLPVIAAMIAASKKPTTVKNTLVEGSGRIITKKQRVIDTNMKEVYCFYFVEPLIKNKFPKTYQKLFDYSTHFVERRKKKTSPNQQAAEAFMNQSSVEMNIQIIAYVLCKKCIHLPLYAKSENIMGFILSQINTKINSIEYQKNNYVIRSIQIGSDSEDEGNESQLEADSLVCDQTMDIEPLIKWMCEECVKKVIKEHNIPLDLFQRVVNFNFKTLRYIEKHFQLFLNTVFTNHFKTCEAIYLLDNYHITQLLSLAQIISVQKKHFDLAIRLTALMSYKNGEVEKAPPSVEADKIIFKANEAGVKLYAAALGCKTRLNPKANTRSLAEDIMHKIKDIGMYFTSFKTRINIEPSLGEMIAEGLENGMEYEPSRMLLFQFCQMMEDKL